jgi:hypothetical protein
MTDKNQALRDTENQLFSQTAERASEKEKQIEQACQTECQAGAKNFKSWRRVPRGAARSSQ